MKSKKSFLADNLGENWDIFDKKGNKIGLKKRGRPFAPNEWHKVANATIVNSQGQILIQQRSFNKIGDPGKWKAEVGGSVLAGEDPLHALKREVKEELSLDYDFAPSDLAAVFKRWPVFDNWYIIKTGLSVADFKIQKEEIEQIKFVSVDMALSLLGEAYRPILKSKVKKFLGGTNA